MFNSVVIRAWYSWYNRNYDILFFVNKWLKGGLGKHRVNYLSLSDKRIKYINEVLQGIKIMKYNAWEELLVKKIVAVRKEKISANKQFYYRFLVMNSINATSDIAMILAAVGIYVAMGEDLDLGQTLSVLGLIGVLKMTLLFLGVNVAQYVSAKNVCSEGGKLLK
eukprot:UN34857